MLELISKCCPQHRRGFPSDPLSPDNETFERRHLKSILKKLSAGSRTGSSDTSATSTPDRVAATAELRKLMRAPTIEGYAARHSKLSKSVTFNKYTLQSPPSEQIPGSYPLGSPSSDTQEQQASLPPPSKLSFRPLGSGGILQVVSRSREEEYIGELVSGIREVIKGRLVSSLFHGSGVECFRQRARCAESARAVIIYRDTRVFLGKILNTRTPDCSFDGIAPTVLFTLVATESSWPDCLSQLLVQNEDFKTR